MTSRHHFLTPSRATGSCGFFRLQTNVSKTCGTWGMWGFFWIKIGWRMADIPDLPCWVYNTVVLPLSSRGHWLLPGSHLFWHKTCEFLPQVGPQAKQTDSEQLWRKQKVKSWTGWWLFKPRMLYSLLDLGSIWFKGFYSSDPVKEHFYLVESVHL